ncbi:hypothetical protein [Haloglycomyces albus]|uniref:hypothetical protein n=1 Tax=Haloglycomyces albus TaxID=526067 RepID=UPI00046C8E09|nr:hypothetical protein [Haloglycomyces albus]
MKKTLGKRALALTGATGLAISLAACNGDDSSDDSKDNNEESSASPFEAVLASTDGFKSEAYAATMEATLEGELFMSGSMEYADDSNNSADMEMYMSAMFDIMAESNPEMADMMEDEEMSGMMDSMFADTSVKTIVSDGDMYMHMSGGMMDMLVEQYGEDYWIQVPPEEAEQALAMAEGQQVDIAGDAKSIIEDLEDVEEIEDGTYEGTLVEGSDAYDSFMGGEAMSDDTTSFEDATVTVALDDQDRLDKLSFTTTMTDTEQGLSMEMDTTIDVTEWGGDYDFSAPEGNVITQDEFEDFEPSGL